jgi:hypothetical protein
MSRLSFLGALALAVIACNAHAARIGIANVGEAWALFLNGEGASGQFDTVGVVFTASSQFTLTNINSGFIQGFTPRAAGDQSTFINRRLDQDPLDGGLGWSILGREVTADRLTFGGGPLGGAIETRVGHKGGWLFLANFLFSPPVDAESMKFAGSLSVELLRAGRVIATLPTPLEGFIIPLPEVPEPAAGVLGCSLLAVLAAVRSRRRIVAKLRARK